MKVCVIGASILPGNMSAVTRTYMIADGLAEIDGVMVDLLIPRVRKEKDKINSEYASVKYFYNQRIDEKNINGKKGKYVSRFRLLFYVCSRLAGRKYDWVIFYAGGGMETLLYAVLTNIFNAKFCSHFADPLPKGKSTKEKLKEFITYNIWGLCIRLSSRIMVISKGMEALIKDIVPKAATVLIPLMVSSYKITSATRDVINKRLTQKKNIKTIVYSGKFTKSSGIIDLLSAAKIMDCKSNDWEMVITGPIFKRSKRHIDIRDVINNMGLSNRVKYAGYLDLDEYSSLIDKADVLVVPKTSDDINSFNLPGKLAEFLLTGNPVVAANVGDISLYAESEHDILLYNAGDINMLSEQIMILASDPALACKIGVNGRKAAQKSFDNAVLMKALYINLIECERA